MHWTGWVVVILAILTGGWMAFDGSWALASGDYLTAANGSYAGQLGPWAQVVTSVGLQPRSMPVEALIAGYGLLALAMGVCFALRLSWAWRGMLAISALGLWYLPVGTAAGLVTLVLLLLPPLRSRQGVARD